MATTIPGGSGVTNHHVLPLFGNGDHGHLGITQGMGNPGARGFGGGVAGISHGHTGSANVGSFGHRFGDHSGGQAGAGRFGAQNVSGLGHDTINLGSGHDSQAAAGRAAGVHVGYHIGTHSSTMAGGAHHTSFIAHGAALGSDTHAGGAAIGHGTVHHLTAVFANHKVGTDVIKNFVTGHDKLYLESHALSYLHSQANVTMSHGSTHIVLDGRHTTIALKGFTHVDTGGHK